jgi:hypothetical protein
MIYGIGLPRTGGFSLAYALDILGYKGLAKCNLTGDQVRSTKQQSLLYIVDNSIYGQTFFTIKPQDKYILTDRDNESHSRSIDRFKLPIDAPYIPTPSSWKAQVRSNIPADQLLILNFFEKGGASWEELCEFLNKPIPYMKDGSVVPFPCVHCDAK